MRPDHVSIIEAAAFTLGCLTIHFLRPHAAKVTMALGVALMLLAGMVAVSFVAVEVASAAGHAPAGTELKIDWGDATAIGYD
ncbi:hypothetical protein [Methylobacterium brachythecii]|uniref:NADPH:quinone reductase-like Zn-dependent oxidoreductase n=1 Tax=Methylobacterium brachythecii TaxID=1176177 RepID=A0A7W6F935_9HYPH|nr:hypothetical protein [Methylobacterium brachythecii]MBB3905103.1 NADPH:quinone reductase-like Zn-dependent oxidoreductase [Methylobacterium brachythecii]GLS44389.1 hypothetical protein GCM10007884_23770 [Methylobacterium brachythecii]